MKPPRLGMIAGMSARNALTICAQAAQKRVRWIVLQCVQGQREVEPWLDARGWQVVRRVDVQQRHRRYATWLVEVGR